MMEESEKYLRDRPAVIPPKITLGPLHVKITWDLAIRGAREGTLLLKRP